LVGWTGIFLNVDLTRKKAVAEPYDTNLAFDFIGRGGFAAKIIWDRLKPGVGPFSIENKLVFTAGPLTGLGLPNSGKLIVAAKSHGRPARQMVYTALTSGPLKGAMQDSLKYHIMLKKYYRKRGWDERGIPNKITLKK